MIIWDEGTAEMIGRARALVVPADGRKLAGGFALTSTGPRRWILIKRPASGVAGSDITAERPESVRSGRTWQDLAR